MSRIYEVMFLIDNNTVRAGWKEAKAGCTGLIEKHGGKVLSARRWEERKLAYPIRQRRRGTYLLGFCELPGEGVGTLRRELDISESVLRYLLLRVEAVPPKELELARLEDAADFRVPEPPPEDVPEGPADAGPEEQAALEEEESEAVVAGEAGAEEV
jgi:small subunit ribosomal protein S6